ncbi:hypothetical protein PENSPDRAFT_672178 [Peniophora sp. CONT]|nr:hypothetical protein PENSPDRAFT_672178 [Peniophora sp. CONT]
MCPPLGAEDSSNRENTVKESDQGYEGGNSHSNSESESDSEEESDSDEEEKEELVIECITTYFDPGAMGDPQLWPRPMNTPHMTSDVNFLTPGLPPRDKVGVNPGAGAKCKGYWTEEGPSKSHRTLAVIQHILGGLRWARCTAGISKYLSPVPHFREAVFKIASIWGSLVSIPPSCELPIKLPIEAAWAVKELDKVTVIGSRDMGQRKAGLLV